MICLAAIAILAVGLCHAHGHGFSSIHISRHDGHHHPVHVHGHGHDHHHDYYVRTFFIQKFHVGTGLRNLIRHLQNYAHEFLTTLLGLYSMLSE